MVSSETGEPAGSNWAGSHTYEARRLLRPRSLDELQSLVAGSERVRAIGSRHSFTDVGDTAGDLVDVSGLPGSIDIDGPAGRASVPAGLRYGDVAAALHRAGWALSNLASLPHISVAGAVATGTHGSGVRNRSLAAAVRALELVTPDGSVRRLERGDPRFAGAVVSIGALGIVTRLELDIRPTFDVRQRVWDDVPFDTVITELPEILGSAYSVSVFTDWAGDRVQQLWVKQLADEVELPARLFGGIPVAGDRHPIRGFDAESCTPLGEPGPWLDRLPHFRRGFTPSAGEEIQSEYLVPSRHGPDAVRALRTLGEEIAALVLVSEIRAVAADDLWLSPAYGEDVVAFHFTWRRDPRGVAALTPRLEDALAPFSARPHWGKVHAVPAPDLRRRLPRYDDFVDLVREIDPAGKFHNAAHGRWFPALQDRAV